MTRPDLDVVTGAFSYTGRAIADELLARGRRVRTLTRRHEPADPLGRASFRSWVAANGERLGRGYVSELARNFRPYDPL